MEGFGRKWEAEENEEPQNPSCRRLPLILRGGARHVYPHSGVNACSQRISNAMRRRT